MTIKNVTFGDQARSELKKGVDLIANAVKATLGPKGRNVLYGYHYGYPISTKDGVTVARQVECKDELAQLGLLIVRQAAQKTADDGGDGTTTSSLLVQAIYNEGLKALSSGHNPILIKRGIDKAVDEVIEYIDSVSIEIGKDQNMMRSIATISGNNDPKIGDLIVEAINKVGENGVITLEDNFLDARTYVETVEGMQLNEGMLSPYFMTDPAKMEAVYKNPKILLIDGEVDNIRPLEGIINEVIGKEGRPLVIICGNMTGQALQVLVSNRAKGLIPLVVCKAPQFGQFRTDQMLDISCLIGGIMVGAATGVGFNDITPEVLGEAESITATKSYTTVVGGKGTAERVKERIAQIETEISKAQSDYDKEKLQERLAKLTSGVAVIKVGGQTEIELKATKTRIEDSLHATRAAIEDGIVPGGGVVYLQSSRKLVPSGTEEEKIGMRIIKNALQEPIKTMAENAGIEVGEIIASILNAQTETISNGTNLKTSIVNLRFGYNFLNDTYGDMIEMGIIDPTKVVKLALKNAASAAGMLLTTEVTVHEEIGEDLMPKTPKPTSM